MTGAERVAAMRRQRVLTVDFLRRLGDEAWERPSRAPGWRVADVVAHLAAGSHALFTPESLRMLRSRDIERTNDALAARRAGRSRDEVVTEYATWSRRLVGLASAAARGPWSGVRLPLGELGRFPAGLLLTGAPVFDWHTHVHHDLAPALDLSPPAIDPRSLRLSLDWMVAVLGEQRRRAPIAWFDRPVALRLTGAGGGSWVVRPDGAVEAVTDSSPGHVGAVVTGRAAEFPEWGTTRAAWRDRDVTTAGDTSLAEAFLDDLDVV